MQQTIKSPVSWSVAAGFTAHRGNGWQNDSLLPGLNVFTSKAFYYYLTSTLFFSRLSVMSSINITPVTESERTYALGLLQESRQRLHQLLTGLSSAQEIYKPNPDRWSIADCVEHIALIETGLNKALQTGLATADDPARRSEIKVSDVDVLKAVRSRTIPISAPGFAVPTGRFGSAEAAWQAFDTQREAAIRFMETEPGDLRTHYFLHRQLGTLDLYQTILLMAGHVIRHCKQIDDVKADASFPNT